MVFTPGGRRKRVTRLASTNGFVSPSGETTRRRRRGARGRLHREGGVEDEPRLGIAAHPLIAVAHERRLRGGDAYQRGDRGRSRRRREPSPARKLRKAERGAEPPPAPLGEGVGREWRAGENRDER